MENQTPETATETESSQKTRVGRRGLLGLAGAGVVAVGAGGFLAGNKTGKSSASTTSGSGSASYPFEGEHQAGVVTPAQDRLHFASFDVSTDSKA